MSAPTRDTAPARHAEPGDGLAERAARQPESNLRTYVALVREGLHEQRRSPLTWGGALGAMSALMVVIWPSIADQIGTMMNQYPESLKKVFGIVQLNTVERYVDAEMFSLVVPLAIAFLAVRCIARPTVSAEERGYLTSMLTLPVSRRTVAWSSFTVAGLIVAATLLVIGVLTMLASVIVGAEMSVTILSKGLVNIWPLAMFFAGLALFAAGLLRGSGRVTEVTIGTLVAMYVFEVVGKLAASADILRTISAFRYYGSAIQTGLEPLNMLGLVVAAFILAVVGAEAFQRRDIA